MDESHRASSVASGEAPLSMRQIAGILTRALEDEGYALGDLLAETTISPARIDTMGEHSDWGDFQQLVRNALRLTENPALGLWFGRRVRLASLGLLGFAAISSHALRLAARHARTRSDRVHRDRRREPGEAQRAVGSARRGQAP